MAKIRYFNVKVSKDGLNYSQKVVSNDIGDIKPCPFCGASMELTSQLFTPPVHMSNGCIDRFNYSLLHIFKPIHTNLESLDDEVKSCLDDERKDMVNRYLNCPIAKLPLYAGVVSTDPKVVEDYIANWNMRIYEKEDQNGSNT